MRTTTAYSDTALMGSSRPFSRQSTPGPEFSREEFGTPPGTCSFELADLGVEALHRRDPVEFNGSFLLDRWPGGSAHGVPKLSAEPSRQSTPGQHQGTLPAEA